MKHVLFVKANDRPASDSISVQMYETFLREYRNTHPEDVVTEVNLHRDPPPFLGQTVLQAGAKAAKGMPLTLEEQQIHEKVEQNLEQFVAADKVVFAFPMWNMTVPAILHAYLDCLNRPGKTFYYSKNGPTGLLPHMKVALLNARGGEYRRDHPSEMAVNFMHNQLRFFGIREIITVVIEGHHQYPDRSAAIIAEGMHRVGKAAAEF